MAYIYAAAVNMVRQLLYLHEEEAGFFSPGNTSLNLFFLDAGHCMCVSWQMETFLFQPCVLGVEQ
jgi:hypothetical protein